LVTALFRVLAATVVTIHLAFVAFVVLGGVLVLRWPRAIWLHVPAAAWGVAVEFADWICPLTPVENFLRERAGTSAYHGDFVEAYLLPLLYPARLTRAMQIALGVFALTVNALVYWRVATVRPAQAGRRA
jgi:Protein of Unknown function (DUF2784)